MSFFVMVGSSLVRVSMQKDSEEVIKFVFDFKVLSVWFLDIRWLRVEEFSIIFYDEMCAVDGRSFLCGFWFILVPNFKFF